MILAHLDWIARNGGMVRILQLRFDGTDKTTLSFGEDLPVYVLRNRLDKIDEKSKRQDRLWALGHR